MNKYLKIFDELCKIELNCYKNYDLRKCTTFRIGGIAKIYICPTNELKFVEVLNFCTKNKIKYCIIGAGSNILFKSLSFYGVVICTTNLNYIKQKQSLLIVGAGTPLSKVINYSIQKGLSGLEWGIGIPATIGGAVVMNAGAFGGEMSNVVFYVKVWTPDGVKVIKKQNIFFDYRSSVFTNSKLYAIIEVTIKLNESNFEHCKKIMTDIILSRSNTQKVGFPSAGSVFKRMGDLYPAKLIQESGLKGSKIGGAMISTVHSGYIVNVGNATGLDVLTLIKFIKKEIKKTYNINLQLEIIVI